MNYTEKRIDKLLEEFKNAKVREKPDVECEIINTSEIEEPWKYRRWNEKMRIISN